MARMESPEDATKTVSARINHDLVEEFDAVLDEREMSRSEALRNFMRSVVADGGDGGSLEPPKDDETLAKGYKALVKSTGGGRSALPLREAKSLVARETGIPAETVGRRVIGPLNDRGYIRKGGDPINDPWIEVR